MKKNNTTASAVAILIFSFIFIIVGNMMNTYTTETGSGEEARSATVIEIEDDKTEELIPGMTSRVITFIAQVNWGEDSNQKFRVTQTINSAQFAASTPVEVGDNIVMIRTTGVEDWSYSSHNRIPGMLILGVVFLGLIVAVGLLKGLWTILSLVITISSIFFVYIPSILAGQNVYITTIIIALFIIFTSLCMLNGFNKKTLCAIVGNLGGVLVVGLVTVLVSSLFGISGMLNEEYMFLINLENGVELDLKAIVWAAVVIGSLGAIMDVAMSISSAMQELAAEMQDMSFIKMTAAGMRIGKDAIGTMTNTLILAYVGSSLATVLLFASYNRDLLIIMNFELMIVEIIQAIVGSIGILVAVPLTVLFSALIFQKKENENGFRFKG